MLADTGIWLPVIAIGAMLLAGGMAYSRSAKKSWEWSVADAVITKVGKLKVVTDRNAGSDRWDTSLSIHVEYVYMAGGEQWKNEYIARWRSIGRRELSEASEFRQNNPVGKRIQLLYNPNNPFDSLLNGPRNPAIGSVIGMLGLSAVAFGLINWVFDPPLAAQVVLIVGGIIACAGVFAFIDYPFERPWWFARPEEETELFIQKAIPVKRPAGFDRFRTWSD